MTSNRLGMQSLEIRIGFMRCPHDERGMADSRESIEDTIHLRQITCSLKIPKLPMTATHSVYVRRTYSATISLARR